MPIRDDEFDFTKGRHYESQSMSKAELRKTQKPVMEKRRRDRINNYLNEIKELTLEAMKKDPARYSKLEKADILEMAVRHLQKVQNHHQALSLDPSSFQEFQNGFIECTSEIDMYLSQFEGLDTCMKQSLLVHLQNCISGIEQVAQFNLPGFNNLSFLSSTKMLAANHNSSLAEDQNNNPKMQELQLVPRRLPNGELAFLVTNSYSVSSSTTQNLQPQPRSLGGVPSSASAENLTPRSLTPPMSPSSNPEDASPHVTTNYSSSNSYGFLSNSSAIDSNQNSQRTHIPSTSTNGQLQGVKRPYNEVSYPQETSTKFSEYSAPPTKILNNASGVIPYAYDRPHCEFIHGKNKSIEPMKQAIANVDLTIDELPSGSKNNNGDGKDMWRPW